MEVTNAPMGGRRSRATRLRCIVACLLVLGTGACSVVETSARRHASEFCDALEQILDLHESTAFAEDPSPETIERGERAYRDLRASAPPVIVDHVTLLIGFVEAGFDAYLRGDDLPPPPPDIEVALDAIDDYSVTRCGRPFSLGNGNA
jgi:hypothetical protein